MSIEIDYEKLRDDLVDYYGTFMVALFPAAVFELERIQKANYDELLVISKENNFDLDDYELKGKSL